MYWQHSVNNMLLYIKNLVENVDLTNVIHVLIYIKNIKDTDKVIKGLHA